MKNFAWISRIGKKIDKLCMSEKTKKIYLDKKRAYEIKNADLKEKMDAEHKKRTVNQEQTMKYFKENDETTNNDWEFLIGIIFFGFVFYGAMVCWANRDIIGKKIDNAFTTMDKNIKKNFRWKQVD